MNFYTPVGRAAQRMPRLKYMELHIHHSRARHEFKYKVKDKTVTASWADEIVFQPEERVLQIWRDVACQHTGSHSSLEVEIKDLSIL
jgi:hypothetical protein